MKTFEEFVEENRNKIFRMLELRRVGDWTPYEIEGKFMDQDQYVDNQYNFVKIVDVIELPDGDLLIGYKLICDWKEHENEKTFEKLSTHYRKLSQIELSIFPRDMEEENWY